MANTLKWIWLAQRCGPGNSSYGKLLANFETVEEIYSFDGDYRSFGIGPRTAARLRDKNISDALHILEFCNMNEIDIITLESDRYPQRLKNIVDPPAVLYVLGRLPDMDGRFSLAVVGTRELTDYGHRVAYDISYGAARAGAVIVSGMAKGIDGVAAAAAIDANGKTVAVLGSGLDIVYPPEHKSLMKHIAKNGAVVSEYPPGTRPDKRNFPIRNRIISGLCQATLVIEGDMDSGSLITAKRAREQGRDLYAVPGMVGEITAEGTNDLLKSGATAVTHASDIISRYEVLYRDSLDITKAFEVSQINPLQSAKNHFLDFVSRAVGAAKAKGKGIEPEQERESSLKNQRNTAASESERQPRQDAEQRLAALNADCAAVYRAMPSDSPCAPSELALPSLNAGKIMSALTMLEIHGLVRALPGGLYERT